jgi:hypothetical protein
MERNSTCILLMASLKLYIMGHVVADWDIQMPSYSDSCESMKGLSKHDQFKLRCENRKIFVKTKTENMMLNHIRAIMKYEDDWQIELTVESKI